MKNLLKGICIASVFVVTLAFANQAKAVSINFGNGTYDITDIIAGSYAETISFTDADIQTFLPGTDTTFNDAGIETLSLADLTIVQGSKTTVGALDFFDISPTTHVDGFTVFDDDGSTILIQADLEVSELVIFGGTGSINSLLSLNLSNLTSDLAAGVSAIVDAFVYDFSPNTGFTTISLQFTSSLSDAITSGAGVTASTYSGSAAAVPEPGTIALLGIGLAGLVGVGVRRRAKKNAA